VSAVNGTHDPALRSWVASANQPGTDFPIQNLPFGVFARGGTEAGRVGVAIGDRILDLTAAYAEGLFAGDADVAAQHCAVPRLNDLMALGPRYWSALRAAISSILRDGSAAGTRPGCAERILARSAEASLKLPAVIGDYTDFYASIFHATNVGALFRPESPLLPNYKFVPIGYHGRASSIVPSGGVVRRPVGQTKPAEAAVPVVGPTRALDYEAEVGFFVGTGSVLGEPVPVDSADSHLFGACLLNDWSARDIQSWEYQPLGPFLSKNFATTVSPWVVSMEALAPFRAPPFVRPAGDPAPLPYLTPARDATAGGVDLTLEVWLTSRQMRERDLPAVRLSRSNAKDLYWTPAQLLAHHTSGGCDLRPGDLLATGTVSGATRDALGCLLELTKRGAEPLTLPTGEERRFLEDGDEVVMRGRCERPGAVSIGFGECRGAIGPAASPGTNRAPRAIL
jgi:fumarylacetoacetase